MISVDEARARVLGSLKRVTETERLPLIRCDGRVLAAPVVATRDQPPFPASAMDGYAVRARDTAEGSTLRVIGTSRAGERFNGTLDEGEAVRIFTGAPVPEGADAILIQENAIQEREHIRCSARVEAGRYVRAQGYDFAAGATVLSLGTRIGPGELTLLAAANVSEVEAFRRPRVAIIATGDELVPVGDRPNDDQIIASSVHGVRSIFADTGADVRDCGIAHDDAASLNAAFDRAVAFNADLIVTLGGASVGDHDLVGPVLSARGIRWAFEKVAMRPGKPLMYGGDERRAYLGLPGNPVSSLVCALVFGVPAVAAMNGREQPLRWLPARLGTDLGANDEREEFMRVRIAEHDGLVATPFPSQDSSLISRYASADALMHRPANAAAAQQGDPCRIVFLRTADRSGLREWGGAG